MYKVTGHFNVIVRGTGQDLYARMILEACRKAKASRVSLVYYNLLPGYLYSK